MSASAGLGKVMARHAADLLAALPAGQRETTLRSFGEPVRTQWTYLPRPRPGPALADMPAPARKAALRLLASALSRHAFAQAVTIMALEEVLDLDEQGRRSRHSGDYRIVLFGTPGPVPWCWRLEGHHLSVTATIAGGEAVAAPVFLGANPARVSWRDHRFTGPLCPEEDLARRLLTQMTRAQRRQATVAASAPPDIRTGTARRVAMPLEPAGIDGSDLGATGRRALGELADLYIDRLAPALAAGERGQAPGPVTFAWEGSPRPGQAHYYRIQTPYLLAEYCNTAHAANHAHTVLRLPGRDFGSALLQNGRP